MSKEAPALALYRKYRSQDFSELVGQVHVTSTLANAVENGRISHAYLFAGPRGTGKTSAARIFARLVNGLDPDQAKNHLDIIEIDAASNRRIDEVRDLRDKVHVAPTSAKYKVYIIDEAHMLTTEAFNALLKTLEEPPPHVIFILATTEPHKLPETILSRTQRFSFRPVELATLTAHLKKIAKAEGIKIDDDALELIALSGDGSVRDSLSLLDQLANISNKDINSQSLADTMGLAAKEQITALLQAVASGDAKSVLATIDQWIKEGFSAHQIHLQLLRQVQLLTRKQINNNEQSNPTAQFLAKLQRELSQLTTTSLQPWAELEAILLQASLPNLQLEPTTTESTAPEPQPVAKAAETKKTKPTDTKPKTKEPEVKSATAGEFSEDKWIKALTQIKQKHNSLYALLRTSAHEYDAAEQRLLLHFRFQFHRRRLEEGKNKRLLEQTLTEVFGWPILVESVVAESPSAATADEVAEDQDAVSDVLNILGGEVVNDQRK